MNLWPYFLPAAIVSFFTGEVFCAANSSESCRTFSAQLLQTFYYQLIVPIIIALRFQIYNPLYKKKDKILIEGIKEAVIKLDEFYKMQKNQHPVFVC